MFNILIPLFCFAEVLLHQAAAHLNCQNEEMQDRGRKGKKRIVNENSYIQKRKRVKLNDEETNQNNLTYRIQTGHRENSSLRRKITHKYFPISLFERDEETNLNIPNPNLCIGDSLEAFRKTVRLFTKKYFSSFGGLLLRLRLQCRMEKIIKNSPLDEDVFHFSSYAEGIEEFIEYNEVYNRASEKVWEEFVNFVSNGNFPQL